MRITILGSSGSEGPGLNTTAFLIDGRFLLDAGTVAESLDIRSQCEIGHILLTHAHLDHIKGIPFLADNLLSACGRRTLTIVGGKDVLGDLRRNIFNNRIWPDFSVVPDSDNPVIRYRVLSPRDSLLLNGYSIRLFRVDHTVSAYGYMIEDDDGAVFFSGDTGPTERIWKLMRGRRVKGLFIEVSFPDDMSDFARLTGHLSPSLFGEEMRKMPVRPERIFITHLKPHYREIIRRELENLPGPPVELLEDGMIVSL